MVFKILIRIFFLPLILLEICIPKKDTIWIFGSWNGKTYSDNSKYLYEFAQNHKDTHIRPIWLTKKKSIVDELRMGGKECYLFYSLKGIYYSIIARVVVVSRTWNDLPLTAFLTPHKTFYVQLWHGTPLKKLNKVLRGSFIAEILKKVFRAYIGRDYDLVISATEKTIPIYKKVFSVTSEQIHITGQPRNDVFQSDHYKSFVGDSKRIILYMPTWRKQPFNYFDKKFRFDLQKIDAQLEKENAVLIVKLHFHMIETFKEIFNTKNIIFLDDISDIYPYLPSVDILLTDYSSIFFDFLLLDKPIIFMPFDKDKYVNEVGGFYFDYADVTPGYKAQDWSDVFKEVQKIFRGQDSCKSSRKKINNIFNRYHDSHSSMRVYTLIKDSIGSL